VEEVGQSHMACLCSYPNKVCMCTQITMIYKVFFILELIYILVILIKLWNNLLSVSLWMLNWFWKNDFRLRDKKNILNICVTQQFVLFSNIDCSIFQNQVINIILQQTGWCWVLAFQSTFLGSKLFQTFCACHLNWYLSYHMLMNKFQTTSLADIDIDIVVADFI
jgi:hypothetical protein